MVSEISRFNRKINLSIPLLCIAAFPLPPWPPGEYLLSFGVRPTGYLCCDYGPLHTPLQLSVYATLFPSGLLP